MVPPPPPVPHTPKRAHRHSSKPSAYLVPFLQATHCSLFRAPHPCPPCLKKAPPSEENGTSAARSGKPGSVGPPQRTLHHLSRPGITPGLELPTRVPGLRPGRPSPRAEAAEGTLFGISTHGVYLHRVLLPDGVGSYPTFSPLPRPTGSGGAVHFLWHYSVPFRRRAPAVSRRGALRCPDFPLAHPDSYRGASGGVDALQEG
ncbi:hypothetical protein LEM8419_02174 [Neolewinella maritima]|uniref:Uncharacterized protein n=1 Tax=Neolewinella maritima TaxID=1383882 RepID=A0ABM9B1S0_9BACT|nr:hypothetical protein LEM8419_02174 [Neolewinella maritima]